MNVGGHARIAERADQNGVEIAGQRGKTIRRDRYVLAQVAVGAPVEVGKRQVRPGGLKHAHGLRDDFLPDSVAGNNSDPLPWAHSRKGITGVVVGGQWSVETVGG